MNLYINSGRSFFTKLEESGLIIRMIDESPIGVIDAKEFHLELLRLFKGLNVNEAGVKASLWTVDLIEYVQKLTRDGTLDIWSDQEDIREYYMTEIVYEHWKWDSGMNARRTRVKTLRNTAKTADELERLREMEESVSFLSAKGWRYNGE